MGSLSLQRRRLWIFCLWAAISFVTILPCKPYAVEGARPSSENAEKAWSRIASQIDIFWKEREETPFSAKKSAWHIIAILKDFIARYPESPHVPEAYYYTGIAYKEAGFMPEAISHWRIVAKDFPNSKWADEALMEILAVYEEEGEIEKKKRLLREIVRQYPDTTSAEAAWISLALASLMQGKEIPFIEKEMKKLEQADPNIASKVPVFLELKARLSLLRGRKKEAIREWLHFLNLTTTKGKQALALYEIAEIYRSLGDFLSARKYYALCARDYPRSSYALFARFRLAQLHERELGIVPWARNMEKEVESSQWLYSEILKKFPRHPITQEVIYEFAKLKMRINDLAGALELVKSYFETNPEGVLSHLFIALSNEIQKRMKARLRSEETIKKALHACLELIEDGFLREKLPGYVETAKALWKNLIDIKMKKGDFDGAIEESNALVKKFGADDSVVKFSKKAKKEALEKKLKLYLAQKKYLELLNFFYENMDKLKGAFYWKHYQLVGKAWDELGMKSEAAFYYGRAFLSDGRVADNDTTIMDWVRALAAIKDTESLGRILRIYDQGDQGHKPSAEYYHYRSLYEQMRGKWDLAYENATKGLELSPEKKVVRRELLEDLIRSSWHLRLWDVAHNAFRDLEHFMGKEEKIIFLNEWGDIAFQLMDYEEALSCYNMVLAMEPGARDTQLKMAIVLFKQGRIEDAQGILKALSVDEDEFYATYSKALLEDSSFWRKIPREFKAGVR